MTLKDVNRKKIILFVWKVSCSNVWQNNGSYFCGWFYCRPLLFIHLYLAIIVYPFIVTYYCRPLLFILVLSTIIVCPFIVVHYCLSYYCQPLFFILLWSTIIVYPFIFGHYWASIKNISVCPNLTHRCEVWVGR